MPNQPEPIRLFFAPTKADFLPVHELFMKDETGKKFALPFDILGHLRRGDSDNPPLIFIDQGGHEFTPQEMVAAGHRFFIASELGILYRDLFLTDEGTLRDMRTSDATRRS